MAAAASCARSGFSSPASTICLNLRRGPSSIAIVPVDLIPASGWGGRGQGTHGAALPRAWPRGFGNQRREHLTHNEKNSSDLSALASVWSIEIFIVTLSQPNNTRRRSEIDARRHFDGALQAAEQWRAAVVCEAPTCATRFQTKQPVPHDSGTRQQTPISHLSQGHYRVFRPRHSLARNSASKFRTSAMRSLSDLDFADCIWSNVQDTKSRNAYL